MGLIQCRKDSSLGCQYLHQLFNVIVVMQHMQAQYIFDHIQRFFRYRGNGLVVNCEDCDVRLSVDLALEIGLNEVVIVCAELRYFRRILVMWKAVVTDEEKRTKKAKMRREVVLEFIIFALHATKFLFRGVRFDGANIILRIFL